MPRVGAKATRRLVLVALSTCGALGVLAPAAFAHTANVAFNGCTSVTFNYANFPTTGTNVASEVVKINGTVVKTQTATWSGTSTYTDTVDYNGTGDTGNTIVGSTSWTGSESDGASGSGSGTKNLSGCAPKPVPLVYTGRAYDASVSAALLGVVSQLVGPVNDTGAVSTTATTNKTTSVVPITGSPITASVLNTTQTTGNGSSFFAAQVGEESVSGLSLPSVASSQVTTTSKTTCNASTGKTSSVGTTDIVYLKIGGTVIVGAGGLYAPDTTFTPNFTINLGLAKVVINEQIPITNGLAVNAVDVTAGIPNLLTTQVIVAHAESDIEGC
jgi:hypothetical protein